jgi:hypothetical protein
MFGREGNTEAHGSNFVSNGRRIGNLEYSWKRRIQHPGYQAM